MWICKQEIDPTFAHHCHIFSAYFPNLSQCSCSHPAHKYVYEKMKCLHLLYSTIVLAT
jgi:hypothetical protein